jgi:Na+-driven multidrug efflux pump
MIGFVVEATLNILLDYLLIFGKAGFPQMGFNGAAVASVIAEIAGLCTVLLVIIYTGLRKKYGLLNSFTFNRLLNKEILKVSAPLVTQYLISVSTWLIFFLLIDKKGSEARAVSNVMRNVFGLAGVFVWAFASTTSSMVSNLIGQQKEDKVIPLIIRIMCWSMGLCLCMTALLNIFPEVFFHLFGQDESFVAAGIPVIRTVSFGMLFMSIANIWLNGVTGTGKTRMNLAIEIIAISLYLCYTWYFMRMNYISLAVAWTNEFIYWTSIFIMAFIYMRSGRWKTGGHAV